MDKSTKSHGDSNCKQNIVFLYTPFPSPNLIVTFLAPLNYDRQNQTKSVEQRLFKRSQPKSAKESILTSKKINTRILNKSLRLRPISASDLPFLQQLYATTRTDIQTFTGWTQQQKDLLIQQQFQAQHLHYQQHYKNATFDLVRFKKSAIGRLYIDRQERDIRIVDIALLPKYHGQGIGTFLLKNVLAEGKETGKVVSLHVRWDNPALKLYERLGFVKKEEVEERFLLEWNDTV